MTREHESHLQLLLESEVLLGGGLQLQSGLPTVLQAVMHTFAADSICLMLATADYQVKFDFPTAYGQTALLLRAERAVTDDPQRMIPWQMDFDTTSFLMIPAQGTRQRYGILQLAFAQKPPFSPNDRMVLQMIGRQIGIALENAAHVAALQRQTFELGLLSRLGESLLNLLSSLQMDKVVGRILDAVRDLLGVEETSIFLKDLETGELHLWQYTPAERNLAIRLKPGQGVAGWVLAHNKAAVVNDVHQDPRWERHFDETVHFITRSLLAIPIVFDGEIIGVVEALNKLNGEFTEADQRWLETLAKWAAVAISNANTYDELTRTHERLSDAKKQAAMAQMVLNLAHRINNSVGAVRVWSLECLQDMQRSNPDLDVLHRHLDNILANAEETLEMVRRIRSATEIRTNVPSDLVDVKDALETALVVSRLARQIRVERHYDDHLPYVAAQPERLVEVFLNLLDNASDALGKEGAVICTLRRAQNGAVEALIQDNGMGVAEHLRATLFDPFVTSKTEGLGLGLWMVKLYVELIGGSISMSSTTGKGTTFRITLPAWEGQTDG